MSFRAFLALLIFAGVGRGQEASAGIDLRATLSVGMIDGRSPGFRAVVYPTIKLDEHWSFSGAVQFHSVPFFVDEMRLSGHSLKTDVLQGTLNYSRFWHRGSLVLRTGALSSAFGSFLLRYDDAVNPLINSPRSYGYYYEPVTTLGLMGVEASGTYGRIDARAQFTNSSPANRRSVFSHDQYGDWTAGGGYTIREGLRAGASFYTGPYLDQNFAFYFPGEAPPHQLPARAFGIDAQWAAGHWNIEGELQRFVMHYRLIPDFRMQAEYIELRRVLHPRWFVAERTSNQAYEAVVGFRPNTHQIIKAGYGVDNITGAWTRRVQLQVVTTLHPVSIARR